MYGMLKKLQTLAEEIGFVDRVTFHVEDPVFGDICRVSGKIPGRKQKFELELTISKIKEASDDRN